MPGHHGSSGTSAGVSQGQHHGDVAHGPKGRLHTANTKTTNTSTGTNGKKPPHRIIGTPEDYRNPPFKNPVPNVGPISWGINLAAKHNYKSKEKYARKHGLYRDYYRAHQYEADPTKRTLKTNTPEGREYLKDAGYSKRTTTAPSDGHSNRCADGSSPHCGGATSAGAAKPMIANKPYYMGFDFQEPMDPSTHRASPGVVYPYKKGGLSGGKRYGPPPKKGPNPHGTCPSRPDGIRGVGAVQPGRGVKFVGVK